MRLSLLIEKGILQAAALSLGVSVESPWEIVDVS